MWAFGLVETNQYRQAETAAKEGLQMNCSDVWSTHALAHVYEMEGRQEEGVAFLRDTVSNWSVRQ
jgi:Tfp pilus assembly protein PilF